MIRIENLHISLPGFSLREINIHIKENEFFILMGPTGAGKTVLLEGMAGLVPIKSGKIFVEGGDITGVPPEKRGISIVYQDHALFPHLTVRDNIRYGLRYHAIETKEGTRRFQRLIDLLDIPHLLERIPLNLSGGEKQRVALARALIVAPKVILLDEPLSALDPNFREEIRSVLKRLQRSSGVTFVMVTHDFAEALAMADRAAVLNNGLIEQTGTIEDIFQKPDSAFVADFVGMKNLFKGEFRDTRARIADLEVDLGCPSPEGKVYVAIRPEDIAINRDSDRIRAENKFEGKVKSVIDQGFTYEIQVGVGEILFKALITKKALFKLGIREGSHVFLGFKSTAIHTF